jgi:hypothetical protein
MPIPDIRPETIALINTMAGSPSVSAVAGGPIDVSWIDPLALGDLWTAAHATQLMRGTDLLRIPAANAARAIQELGDKMEPLFRGSACRDYLVFLAPRAEQEAANDAKGFATFAWENACFALRRCIEPSHAGLAAPARRLLEASKPHAKPQLAIALARLVDAACEEGVLCQLAIDLAHSPLVIEELRVAASLDLTATILLADIANCHSRRSSATTPEGRYRLSDCPPYPTFAEAGLRAAAERVRNIHAFEIPYASDKAFTLSESAVIARLACVALDRDEIWLPAVLEELFHKVSVAPTAAKTMPSQSVALALGHAIEAFPTPEAVTTLREVVRDIRHAGVKKRLPRNLRGAERDLAKRPEIALRLPPDLPVSKSQLTILSHCLEAGFALDMTLAYEDWRARLVEPSQVRPLTASLVWRFLDRDGASAVALPVLDGERMALLDAAGEEVAPSATCRVALWHPLSLGRNVSRTRRMARPLSRVADQATFQTGVS